MEQIAQYIIDYRYGALLLAALAEGPVVAFVAGALLALGHLSFWPAIAVLTFKDLVLDTVFYAMGRATQIPFIARQVQKVRAGTNLADRVLSSIEHGWQEHPIQLMWVGKLAYGLSAWFLVSAGMAGVPLRKFYLYTLPVTLFQFGGLMTLGYVLGLTMWERANWIMVVIQLMIACVVLFFVVKHLTQTLRKRFVKFESGQ